MYFAFCVSHPEESGRYYSDVSEALAHAAEMVTVLARGTRKPAQVVVQRYLKDGENAPMLLWEINAYPQFGSMPYPRLTIVNLF